MPLVFGQTTSNQRNLRFNPFCEELQLCNLWPSYEAIDTTQVPDSTDIVHTCVNSFGAIRAINVDQTCDATTETAVNLNAEPSLVGSGRPATISGGTSMVSTTGGGQSIPIMQPYLSVTFIIALEGIFPSQSRRAEEEEEVEPEDNNHHDEQQQRHRRLQTSPYLGEIKMFAGGFAPQGWALCEGQLMSIAQNTALFSLLGTTYGGDGRSNFALPDLRGRVAVSPTSGAPGLPTIILGDKAGVASVTPGVTELTPHTHTITTVTGTLTLS